LIFTSNAASSPDTIAVNSQPLEAILSTTSRNVNVNGARVDSTSWTLISLYNTGNDTLRFVSDTSTNSVFSSHLSAMVIAPGDTIIDSVKFLPTTMGADSGKLTFKSNSTTTPDTISVNSSGKEAILKTNSLTVNTGATHVDTAAWTIITLSNTGNDTLRFVSATSTNSVFTSHLSALFIAPGKSIVDSIKFLPTAMGADSGKLIFTGNATTSPDTIAVSGIGKEAILAINPRTVDFGTTLVNTSTSSLVTFYNAGNDTLSITAITSTNKVFSSQQSALKIAPGASVGNLLKFLPTAAGLDTGEIIITSNSITSPDMIAVSGTGVTVAQAAILDISSRNVNCGTTQVGTPTWTLVTLFNTGNDTLRFTSETSNNAVFSSHLSSLLIPPGTSINDSIKFLPVVAGKDLGTLILTSNSLTSPDTINVFGIGVNSLAKTAIFDASSRIVDCGIAKVGTHTWTLVTISNPGTDTLFISNLKSTNDVFASSLSQMAIAPGTEIIDLIVFLPDVVGEATGQLIFTSNSTTSPDTISVFGDGTPAATAVYESVLPSTNTLGEMYPNPVSSDTRLQITMQNGEQLLHAGMYDVLGHELQDWTARISSNGSFSVNAGVYPNGMYFVRLLTSTRMQVLPVVIAR